VGGLKPEKAQRLLRIGLKDLFGLPRSVTSGLVQGRRKHVERMDG
jgi:hypothetical protein